MGGRAFSFQAPLLWNQPIPAVTGRESSDGLPEPPAPHTKSLSRHSLPPCGSSATTITDEQPHTGNYRLLKTIGKGNFAKVKLARQTLTARRRYKYQHTVYRVAQRFADYEEPC
uniref:Protein kinase domain-containing protein n=1 Tax=Amphilophus citrinellus TaxID=61819 RepID=A0A3Q0RJA1_AMPCI